MVALKQTHGWTTTTIGDVARVVPGFAFKSKDWSKTGIPVLKIKNIRPGGGVDTSACDCVPESIISPKLKKFWLQRGDILLAMTGATAGKVGRILDADHFLLNQRVAKLEPINIENEFFWAVVSSDKYEKAFFSLADGAAQPNMSGKQIESVEIPLPPLPVQRRIAGILSAYDDLIENNTHRINALEEMARRMYQDELVESGVSGLAPLTNVGAITYGFPFQSKQFCDDADAVGVVRIRDVRRDSCATRTHEEGKEIHLIHVGDILVGMDGDFHMSFWAGQKAWLNQRVLRIRPLTGWSAALIFQSIQEPIHHLNNTIVGTTVAHLSARDMNELAVPNLTPHIVEKLNQLLQPMFEMHIVLRLQNANLRAQRDLLLPRLVSGEIDVSEGEVVLEDAAA